MSDLALNFPCYKQSVYFYLMFYHKVSPKTKKDGRHQHYSITSWNCFG